MGLRPIWFGNCQVVGYGIAVVLRLGYWVIASWRLEEKNGREVEPALDPQCSHRSPQTPQERQHDNPRSIQRASLNRAGGALSVYTEPSKIQVSAL